MYKNEKIEIIMTGGTIDSFYDPTKDTVVPLKTSPIPDFIKNLQIDNTFIFNQVTIKDSRDLTEVDLKKILKSVEESSSKHIIITHGTYTMPNTARFLEAKLKRNDQIIILTGSMIPLDRFTLSDAPFNLGYSFASFKILKPGVYVCMNGRVFNTKEVTKIISQGRFVSVFDKN